VSKVAVAVCGMFERRNGAVRLTRIADKKSKKNLNKFFFQKILNLKSYYVKWTLRIEVVNGKKIFIRTYAEEGNFRRSRSEFIILRIPMTEKWPFQKQKICGFGFGRLQETTFFFQKETNFFCSTTLIQLPMAHIKITIFFNFFDRVPQLPAFNGSGV
jgi:hypothetical protein